MGRPASSGLDGAEILLRTTGMTDVSIDLDRRTATVSAGAWLREVIGPAAEHGLVGLHGLSAGVGVIGYALGGGIAGCRGGTGSPPPTSGRWRS